MTNGQTELVMGGRLARLAAFAIDVAIVLVLGRLVGWISGPALTSLGAWSRFIGYAVFVAYFGLFDSFCATPGKLLLRLRVRRIDGAKLSPSRALARAAVLFLPFLCSSSNPGLLKWSTAFTLGEATVALAVGGALVLLWLVGGPTRQALHDLVCQSYVVHASGAGKVLTVPMRRLQNGIVIVWLALVVASLASIHAADLARWPQQAVLERADKAILAMPAVTGTAFFTVARLRAHGPASGRTPLRRSASQPQTLVVRVNLAKKPADAGKFERAVALTVLHTYPPAAQKTSLRIMLAYGYDIGIARDFVAVADDDRPIKDWLDAKIPLIPSLPANLSTKDLSIAQLH
ncbi:MAG: RDD family protein [Cyanobacteria bacterium REEB65]|nr:RDD family protein [Cyanobacteria bacterium REEB65]